VPRRLAVPRHRAGAGDDSARRVVELDVGLWGAVDHGGVGGGNRGGEGRGGADGHGDG